ncbi:MAG: hypothetical protein ABI837_11110, partial [Acidobacteriota bacterium]
VDVSVLEKIMHSLPAELKVRPIPLPDPAPDLRFIQPLLGDLRNIPDLTPKPGPSPAPGNVPPNVGGSRNSAVPNIGFSSESFNYAALEKMRDLLARRLPRIAELDTLRLWPWWPWSPWFDCAPDLIFRATQDCRDIGNVIVDEGPFNTRWNVPQQLDVTLVANDKACCVPKPPPHQEGCLVLTEVCRIDSHQIGGNAGPATPAGYAYPGVHDRPFAETIEIGGTAQGLTNADYYEFEYSPNTPTAWTPIPMSQLATFVRPYWDFSSVPYKYLGAVFAPSVIGGRNVYETMSHYETANPAAWGNLFGGKVWTEFTQLLSWATMHPAVSPGSSATPAIADGVYKVRLRAYKKTGPDTLTEVPMPICGEAKPTTPSELVLAVDNRLAPDPTHATYPPHPCTAVHACVTEPDTDFLSIKIIHGGNETLVEACGQYTLHDSDTLEIRYYAYDPDGHLDSYSLTAYYGESGSFSLVPPHVPAIGAPTGAIPVADSAGPSYVPVASAQWKGGGMVVNVPGSAFPLTCCYLLDLRAFKRTIVSCDMQDLHYNISQRSFMITKV